MKISHDLQAHTDKLNFLSRRYQEGLLTNSLLFTGKKSVGKYKTALALAQNMLCSQGDEACGQCGHCLRVAKEQHESILFIKPEKGMIKVDKAREIIQFLSKKLNSDECRIVIIDGAEKMNPQAANALLKTLEEPPQNCYLFLISSSLYSMLTTIRSRCQIIRFGQLTKQQIQQVSSAEEWLIDFSENDLQKVEELKQESTQALYMDLSESLSFLLQGHFLQALKPIEVLVKDKSNCLLLVQALQLFMKKAYFQKVNLPTLILEWQQQPLSGLSQLSQHQLFILFNEAINMEYEMQANLDMLLVFESFYKKVFSFHTEVSGAKMDRHTHTP